MGPSTEPWGTPEKQVEWVRRYRANTDCLRSIGKIGCQPSKCGAIDSKAS